MQYDLKIINSNIGNVEIIQMNANIDLYNAPELKLIFDEINKKNIHKILLDLANVKFIDSSGLGIIVNQAIFLQKRNFVLKFINVNSTISHVFSLGGFTRSLKKYTTLNQAMESSWAFSS